MQSNGSNNGEEGNSSSSLKQPPMDNTMTQAERERQKALQEAQQVMDSMGINQLDHFNLLGVVANPRGSQHGGSAYPTPTAPTAMSSSHGPNNNSTHSDGSGIMFTDTYQTFESTITSVTEQIEALNHVFEDWSRQYLNDYYYQEAADAVPESQLSELPPELTQLDMSTLQVYLKKSGVVAQTYQRHHQEQKQKKMRQKQLQKRIADATAAAAAAASSPLIQEEPASKEDDADKKPPAKPADDHHADDDDDNSQENQDLMDIPDIFFQEDFDLTDPRTFRALLLTDDNDHHHHQLGASSASASRGKPPATPTKTNNNNASSAPPITAESLRASLEESTHDLFQVPPPDAFTGYLDKVEVALLEQVREKSEAFFQETNRFAQLKEWVSELLADVQRIRGLLEGQARAIESWQKVPQWDQRRKQLAQFERMLEGTNEVLRCKQCIGGLLQAKDDLGAVEQIQYARRLLAGTVESDEEEIGGATGGGSSSVEQGGDENQSQTAQAKLPQHVVESEPTIELGRLQALRTVGQQLDQYESLVVTSLTEEVVDIFLEWNTSKLASVYGLSNGGAPTSSKSFESQRRTLNIVQSLNMCHALSHMTKFYSTRLHDMIRMTVRTTVGEFATDATSKGPGTSVSVSVTAMSLERFIDCLDMLFEQLLTLLTAAAGVDEFCRNEGLTLRDDTRGTKTNGELNNGISSHGNNSESNAAPNEDGKQNNETAIRAILASAAELASKSIAELLRLRKEVHSLVALDDMSQIWDTCTKFSEEVEKLSGHKCLALRSMLLTQAKAFVERKHDSNMTSLAAALDSERWTQCEVSSERQVALTRLCSGRAGVSTSRGRLARSTSLDEGASSTTKSPEAEVEGIRYKVVWSCLLLVEMVMTNIEAAARFQSLASNVVGKVSELLRLFNSRSTQLVLGAGAIHSAARLKSINAKHLSLVTQCLGMIIALLPHVRAALMAQLPHKQHTLLTDLDKIKKEYADHNENVLNKFVSIIGGIVEHGLAKHIGGTNFDARAQDSKLATENGVTCCVFLEGVLTNTRKMHQVLSALLPPEHLQDVFSRIFAFIDQKIPALLISAAENRGSAPAGGSSATFSFPTTDSGKKRLLDEVASITADLNALEGVFPWEFSAASVLAKTLEYQMATEPVNQESTKEDDIPDSNVDTSHVNPAEVEAKADTSDDVKSSTDNPAEAEAEADTKDDVKSSDEKAPEVDGEGDASGQQAESVPGDAQADNESSANGG